MTKFYLTFPDAPKHYFTEVDVGEEFVRTASKDQNTRFLIEEIPPGPVDKEHVRKCAMKVLEFINQWDFRAEIPAGPYKGHGPDHIIPFSNPCREYSIISRKEYDDGNWISVDECLELLKEKNRVKQIAVENDGSSRRKGSFSRNVCCQFL